MFVDMLRARRENVHANFHCCSCAILIFCCKIAGVALCVPCKSADFQGTLKAHLRVFTTESQGRTDSAMEIDMHIFSACTQDSYKRIHASRVTCERLRHVHSLF